MPSTLRTAGRGVAPGGFGSATLEVCKEHTQQRQGWRVPAGGREDGC